MSDWSLHAARIAPLPTEPDPCVNCGNPHDGFPGPRGRLCRRCYQRAGDERWHEERLVLLAPSWRLRDAVPPLPGRLAAVISRGEHRP